MLKHIHPFPARMAPELALRAMQNLQEGATVLDPMVGSGTVLRHAAAAGFNSTGFDLDPLAILISKVTTYAVDIPSVLQASNWLLNEVNNLHVSDVALPWIDGSEETRNFISYWFGQKQRNTLRKIAFVISQLELTASRTEQHQIDVLKVALSRIIVTKENGASLARDVSHSRPHKVRDNSDYDVAAGYRRSIQQILSVLGNIQLKRAAKVFPGDARNLFRIDDSSVDLVMTSPPYLNAIDYLRGHRLSLIWLGYTLQALREIRGTSIGSERRYVGDLGDVVEQIKTAMIEDAKLPSRHTGLISRYAMDINLMMGEIARVLKRTGMAVLVVGDCCLQSQFVSNSNGITEAATAYGLRLVSRAVRDLPSSNRYLPISTSSVLSKRMRVENVMTFAFA